MFNDCPKCGKSPCMCGHVYGNWPKEKRIELAAVLLELDKKELERTINAPFAVNN